METKDRQGFRDYLQELQDLSDAIAADITDIVARQGRGGVTFREKVLDDAVTDSYEEAVYADVSVSVYGGATVKGIYVGADGRARVACKCDDANREYRLADLSAEDLAAVYDALTDILGMKGGRPAAEPRKAVVCDIDGTIAQMPPSRLAMLGEEPTDWDRFYEDPFDDEPREGICALVRRAAQECRIIFCTSRRDSVRAKTLAWLRRHLDVEAFPHGYALAMRHGNDPRADADVKPEALEEELTDGTQVLFVLEDSEPMARRWRELGFTCLRVA